MMLKRENRRKAYTKEEIKRKLLRMRSKGVKIARFVYYETHTDGPEYIMDVYEFDLMESEHYQGCFRSRDRFRMYILKIIENHKHLRLEIEAVLEEEYSQH